MDIIAKDMTGNDIKVGDVVGFKSDIEQIGRVIKIERSRFGGMYTLTLENPGGFIGEYIGGQTVTTESADRCWND